MILDRHSAVPLYVQIYQHLLDQIHCGALQPGNPIPSETELASSLAISRMTARQAVKALCDAGVTYSQRGLGTFVSGGKQVKTSTELLSFTQEMKSRGGRPSSHVLAFEKVEAAAEVARALHLAPKAKVFRLKRVRISDSVAMSIEECFLPAKLSPNLLEVFDPRNSLYQVLSRRYGIRLTAADELAEASLAQPEEARLLRIKKGSPVFLLTRITYSANNQPIEFVRSVYRGDRWKLASRLMVNPNTGDNTPARRPIAVSATKPIQPHRRKEKQPSNRSRSSILTTLTQA